MKGPILIEFAPDRWGALQRFQRLSGGTYSFSRHTQKVLSGAANHFRKAFTLLGISREHAEKLPEDWAELEKRGYTPARRGKELSALVESILLELYSSIDCTRNVVTSIYRDHRGVKKSTRKFFKAVAEGKVAKTVPQEIRDAFADAHWYDEFRVMRDALTHTDIGGCHLDEKTGKVSYTHEGLGTARRVFVIEDIFEHIDQLAAHVNQLTGQVFQFLNSTLHDDEVEQMCGVFNHRFHSRWVRPSEARDFNSGRCASFKWFEKDENPSCPFVQSCEAYGRRISEQGTGTDA